MNIINAAKAYLVDTPSEWLKVANALTSKISAWGSLQLEGTGSDVRRGLTSLIFPQLLSPDLVHIMAGCRNTNEAQEFLASTIADVLKNKSIEYGNEADNYLDEIVDFTTTDIPLVEHLVTRASDLEGEYDDAAPLLTVHSAQELSFDETELKRVIARAFESLGVAGEDNISSIFRLDIVDVALYQTLIQHPELLRSLDWRTFEKLLADILESFGYEVELQRGTKDGGVDLFAVKKVDVFGPQRFLLQAKRYSNKVGVEPVRQLAFLHSHLRATKSCLATTASFTKGAWELAQQYQWQLELRDFDGLQEWIKHAATKHV